MKLLARGGYIHGQKGPGGGVAITGAGRQASFYDICECVRDPILNSSCLLSHGECEANGHCLFHKEWTELHGAIINFLHRSTFAKASSASSLGSEGIVKSRRRGPK